MHGREILMVLSNLCSFSYDGTEFALSVEKGVSDRLKKGKLQKGYEFLLADFRFCKGIPERKDFCSD